MPRAVSSVAAPAQMAIASSAKIGGSPPRHAITAMPIAVGAVHSASGHTMRRHGRRPVSRQRSRPTRSASTPPQNTAAAERQQPEEHEQATRLDRRQERQHQDVELGVVDRVLHQPRQQAEQDGEDECRPATDRR